MQQATLQNAKIALLLSAMVLSLVIKHSATSHAACPGCDQPDRMGDRPMPTLVIEPDLPPEPAGSVL